MVNKSLRSNIIITISMFLILCSCQKDIKTFLTNGESRSWYYANNNHNLPVYYTFYSNGQLQVTEEDIDGGLSDFSIARDVVWKRKWMIKDDTLLYIGLYREFFRITKQDESTLRLENKNRKIILQAINNIESFAKKKYERRKEICDSLYNIHYKIKVDTLISIGNHMYLFGDTSFSKEFLKLTKAESEVIKPQKGDILIKKKKYILLNKVTPNTIYLYVYNINMNSLNHTPELLQGHPSGMRWDKSKNDIIFE